MSIRVEDSSALPQSSEGSGWAREAVFYGIDIARFRDSNGDGFGDLRGVIEKLDYLVDLGITCLWLLPFYPSDRQDNGYDVTDYLGIDPRFGSLDDFRDLAGAAHERGIRIMLDLVLHHTSAQHPWFQAAESDPGSRYRDYYIWSAELPKADRENVFPSEEDGVWAFSERAGEYFRHTFYSFQPDLRLANDEVWDVFKRVVDFWVALGADGFRIDAATHLFEDKGVPGASADLADRLDDLRGYLAVRAPHVALVGEADVRPTEVAPYFEHGRFELLLNFLANNSLYLSLARESGQPLAECLRGLAGARPGGSWLNFIRNVDELDLEQLDEQERQEVFAAFAPTEDMRIYGRGIRRGWAPMMRTREQLRMTMSLLFALPGAPLLIYGHELGTGDDLARPGRSTVRLPMPWTPGGSGGFTAGGEGGIVDAAKGSGLFGNRRINVEAQQGDADSLFALTQTLIEVRRAHPEIGWATPKIAETGDGVIALDYGGVSAVHNLSRYSRPLPELGGDRLFAEGVGGQLDGYGFAWCRSAASV